jgi:hypothetical protein
MKIMCTAKEWTGELLLRILANESHQKHKLIPS